MTIKRRQRENIFWSLFVVVFLVAAPGVAFAQADSVGIPDNAHKKSYGSGWACDQGYRKADGGCKAVKVPANAFPTNASYGRGWKCKRGYLKAGDTCAVIKVPPNAYLISSGDSWKCDRGYRSVDEACIVVKLPANSYYVDASYGPGWKCDRGYRAIDEACVAVKMPENAHLDYSGNDWECNPPYWKERERCALP